ncbi:MAG: hypothetical protein HKN44_11495 [Ilumatobacter sp.]|nr:hypothetical protein [Ilumatobacter sp.]
MSDYLAAMFRRRNNDGWFHAGRYDATTVDILCALAVLTMFIYGIAGADTFNRLIFNSFLVREQYEVWRVVTWTVATPPDFFPLLGVVFFWVFGQQLEALFGRNRFLIWAMITTIVPAIVLTFLGALSAEIDFTNGELGLQALFLGGIWVYAATYPGVRWFEVIPLWAIAAVFTVLNLLQYNGIGATGKVLFLLVAMAVALISGRSLGLATGWPIPHIDVSGAGQGGQSKRRAPKRSKPSRSSGSPVVEGPWRNAPPPVAPPTGPSPADQAELDALLDKIGASGMDSLSGTEKKRLNELSKRLRNR